MIKVSCPNCGVRLTAPDDFVGRPVNCQKCNTKFILSKRWMNEPLKRSSDASGVLVGDPSQDSGIPDEIQSKVPPTQANVSSSGEITGSAVYNSGVPADPNPAVAKAAIPIAIVPNASGNWGRPLAPELPPASPLENIAKQTEAVRRGAPWLDGYVEARSFVEFFDFRFRRYLTPWILRISWLLVLVLSLMWFFIICFTYLASLIQLGNSGDLPVAIDTGRGIPFPVEAQSRVPDGVQWSPFFVKSGVFLSAIFSLMLALLWIRVLFETIILLFSMGNTLRTIDARRSGDKDKE